MKITKPVSYSDVQITGGFWANKQKINAKTTVWSVYDRFKETHRFDALRCEWKEGQPNKPDIFWDSDVAKWLEGAAYILRFSPDEALEQLVDETIDIIEKNQDATGYFNSHFNVTEQDQRFCRRTDHELYCAGHLMEAAVAYYEVTGKEKFLRMMCKYADYIDRVFRVENSANFTTPGHPEIELALVRLSHAAGEKKYLELSKFFIDQHGCNEKDVGKFYDFANALYTQDHLPLREQKTAEGHAVRAVYLYNAMVDIAKEYGDNELYAACRAIFSNIAEKRMYVTGGIGSTHIGEAFTIDYDLPNATAYAETCAALGLALFAGKLTCAAPLSTYADIAETAIYNGFLSGVSLDGKSFFYENPLEIQPRLNHACTSTNTGERRPITQRLEVFGCSCCPPNVLRFIASIGNFLYTTGEDTLFVHHYINSESTIDGQKIIQTTKYPCDGQIQIQVPEGFARLALRIPGWCTRFTLSHPYELKDGYAYIALGGNDSVALTLDMPVQLIESAPEVTENAGRICVKRGPLVYCLEGVDNGEYLKNMRLSPQAEFTVLPDDFFGAPVLLAKGNRHTATQNHPLYAPVSDKLEEVTLKFIPYFGFANRGETEMLVWILK